jgi:anti-sigma28 factor (negative regulator of flagellin synthesis)
MRIDLSKTAPEAPDAGQSSKSSAATAASSSRETVAGGDIASLSQGKVQELVARVNQVPEIRQERVTALRRAFAEGSYGAPQETAEALISFMQIGSAA